MAGGGKRVEGILSQILAWEAHIVALAEFRATTASQWLASQLSDTGFSHQLTTVNEQASARNALLLASRFPIQKKRIKSPPVPHHRWIFAQIQSPAPFHLGVMHIPNMHTGLKYPYHESVLSLVNRWRRGAGMLIGDTNSGLPDIDEESPAFTKKEAHFMNKMENAKWHDTFRWLYGDERAYTWYSPNGKNGFRLDQAFVNKHLIKRVKRFRYIWGEADGFHRLSDHSAIVIDLDLPLS